MLDNIQFRNEKEKLIIKEINFGIASRIGNTIYINKKIKKRFPELYKNLIKHEKEHSERYGLGDFLIDFKGKNIRPKKDYYLFILANPESLIQFLPIWKYDKKIVFDFGLLLVWTFAAATILLFYLWLSYTL